MRAAGPDEVVRPVDAKAGAACRLWSALPSSRHICRHRGRSRRDPHRLRAGMRAFGRSLHHPILASPRSIKREPNPLRMGGDPPLPLVRGVRPHAAGMIVVTEVEAAVMRDQAAGGARSVQRHPRLPEQWIGFPLQRTNHRSDAMPGHQPATATRLPHAAGALQDVGEVLRATDRDHAPEFGELDRAYAGWQGRGRAQGGSWSRVQSRGNRPGITSARDGLAVAVRPAE
jgi:hypothetical protein